MTTGSNRTMDLHQETGSPGNLRGNFVLLRADTLRLLFRQDEVGNAEHLASTLAPTEEPGLFLDSAGQSGRRFAALSARMTLLAACPADRFVVAPLGCGNAAYNLGWCWNEIRVLIDVELQPQRLPAVLCAPNTPVEHYVNYGSEIAYLCSAERLHAYALATRS